MYKKAIIILIISLVMLSFIGSACADTTEKVDEKISAEKYKGESIWADKDDKVDIKVTSDIPVDIYMMTSEDYRDLSSTNPDFANAKYSKTGVTSTEFSYTIPDDQTYYLVIYNPNNSTATVTYEYTDYFSEEFEDVMDAFGMAVGICVVIVIVIIVVIVLIIYLIFRKKAPAPPPPGVYPPPSAAYPPPQQPGYQQPPPPQYPPLKPE